MTEVPLHLPEILEDYLEQVLGTPDQAEVLVVQPLLSGRTVAIVSASDCRKVT
jgi:hypothetical protein